MNKSALAWMAFAWVALGLFALYVAVLRTDFPPLLTSYIKGTAVWCFGFAVFSLVRWWHKRKPNAV